MIFSRKDAKDAKLSKQIIITLGDDMVPEIKMRGMSAVEIFGVLHEAKRMITRSIEFNEAMAMEAAARQQQELALVRAAIENPKPDPAPKRR